MSNKTTINEIYENAPLEEVVFEVRFPGEPSVACNIDKFFETIRIKFNQVLVTIKAPDQLQIPELYRFESEDSKQGIIVGINKVAYFTKKYPGFKIFKDEALDVIQSFGKLFKLDKLNRTGLRYINIIPFTREETILPIRNYLNIEVNLPLISSSKFNSLNMAFVSKANEEGNITTQIRTILSQDKTREAILLDFDYSKDANLVINKVNNYLEESHGYTKELFENIITDEYKKFMRGEMV